MKKLLTIAAFGAIAFSGAAMAATSDTASDRSDVQADVNAIHKDNAALSKDDQMAADHRAKKAAAKANGNYGTQAGQSVAIGADQTMKGEKQAEKNVDKKILNHDQGDLNEDKTKTGSSY